MDSPLVSICCLTFNHEPYIRECLDGFLMQKTSFPFEILIHDDASTDRTPVIIKEYEKKYPGIIKPIYQTENQHKKKIGISRTFQFPRAKGKYIALCEGDDYWTDPNKLQIQVDFLENNEEFAFCCHRFKIYLQHEDKFINEYSHIFYKDNQDLIIDHELYSKTWITQPLTALIRRNLLLEVVEETRKYGLPRDVHIFYYLLKKGKGISLNRFMGVYRWHSSGVASMQSVGPKFYKGYLTYKELFIYNRDDPFLKKKFLYNLIGFLRYGERRPLRKNIEVFLEGLEIANSLPERLNLFVSFFIPRFFFNFIIKIYLDTKKKKNITSR